MSIPDVLIVGGGAIGLGIAWRLAQQGATVTVIDRGQMAAEASCNATGVVQPLTDPTSPTPYLDLCVASHRLYPTFVEELLALTGIDVEYGTTGVLRVAMNDQEAEGLAGQFAWLQTWQFPAEWLGTSALRSLEPQISPAVATAFLEPLSRWVNTPKLAAAVAAAASTAGVRLLPGHSLMGVEWQGARACAVHAGPERLAAGRFVIAAGTWCGDAGSTFGLTIPVVPVRGQLLALDGEPNAMRHSIYGQRAHMVPWRCGETIVAGTLEYAGFVKAVTAGGIGGLLDGAMDLVPALGGRTLLRTWACLRPGTPDNLPILSRAPGLENVFIATGHFRKGILLAPITADLMADVILDAPPRMPLQPFRLDRPSLRSPSSA